MALCNISHASSNLLSLQTDIATSSARFSSTYHYSSSTAYPSNYFSVSSNSSSNPLSPSSSTTSSSSSCSPTLTTSQYVSNASSTTTTTKTSVHKLAPLVSPPSSTVNHQHHHHGGGDWNSRMLFNRGGSTHSVKDVDKDTFWPTVEAAGDKLVVLDLYTRWCGPCRLIYPKFVKLSDQYDDVVFLKLDCSNDNKYLFSKMGVGILPTFKIFRNNSLVSEVKGAKYEELVRQIEKARLSGPTVPMAAANNEEVDVDVNTKDLNLVTLPC